ncbi:hypothetical protein [Noviherbaspirillum aridicola]|uniref:LTD domain-containing protein n=1 Tax=Noviherbaspirillum aridicola TaxID=2849687 RepID=A0ABQ4Q944_9BURK|nr:hypothetical protein [Noviherbaspirillum aridicola]GIZ53723.1 hypothetical protein NCCP691_37370 [Noviherbaspirillum aridicola]
MIHRSRLPRLLRASVSPLLLAVLAACGGGGGGGGGGAAAEAPALAPASDQATTSAAPASGKLLLSEVASNYYSDDVAWFEIHNGTGATVQLAEYSLSSSWVDTSTGRSSRTPRGFTLPAAEIPPGGYLVVASRAHQNLRANSQMVYVGDGTRMPYWNASGSIELLRDGATVDFVRFGSSTAVPASEDHWGDAAVTALPSGANEHGKAIVRLAAGGMADTNGADDWRHVNFATPAGRNDVPPGVTDSDRDGIPDSAKVAGGTYGGLDLYAMGARPGRRDVFMELDYMQGSDAALVPRREALQMVVDAFARRNIALHIDTGSLHGTDAAAFNLGGGNPVPFAQCIDLDLAGTTPPAGCSSFYAYKSGHFDVRRKLVFHYGLFANSQRADGSAGSSGVAELNGADLIVTLGGYGFTGAEGVDRNMLTNLQASTLMHEFGHNLGLHHGGHEDVNYKPNHYSVMNYMYQFAGLSATPQSPYAAERYYLVNGMKGKTYCNLVENSPCGTAFVIDFSDGSGSELNELALSEAANIGRGSSGGAYADWDDNGAFTSSLVARNINPLWGTAKTVLKDYNEWGNLTLSFSRAWSGASYGYGFNADEASPTQPERRVNPMNLSARNRTVEDPLPQDLHQALRHAHRPWR